MKKTQEDAKIHIMQKTYVRGERVRRMEDDKVVVVEEDYLKEG